MNSSAFIFPSLFTRFLNGCLCCIITLSMSVLAKDDDKLRIMVFGAHPDDCEIKAGGVAAMWAKQGHHVKFVSTTNGDIGHAIMSGGELAKRRTREVHEAAKVLGIESHVMDNHDGELMPTLENRKKLVRLIREWKADIVMGHRPNDYHPDHRYTGVLMQDAAFMVTVSNFCPDTPHLTKNPVFLYLSDGFQKPNPFEPDVVVSIDDVMDQKIDALWTLESQIESFWATFDFETVIPVPAEGSEREKRKQQFSARFLARAAQTANRFRDGLKDYYGTDKGADVHYAEAFEVCEYGRQPTEEELKQLFPFFNAGESRAATSSTDEADAHDLIEPVPDRMRGISGMVMGRLLAKDVEEGSLVMRIHQVKHVWKGNKAENPQEGVGRVLALDGVFGRFLDQLLVIREGDLFEIEVKHDSGDHLKFLGEGLKKVPGGEADWKASLKGFKGILGGKLVEKDTEKGTLKLQPDSLIRVWKANEAKDPVAAFGKTIDIEGVTGRWLDVLLVLEKGNRIEVEAFYNKGDSLDFIGEWLKKAD